MRGVGLGFRRTPGSTASRPGESEQEKEVYIECLVSCLNVSITSDIVVRSEGRNIANDTTSSRPHGKCCLWKGYFRS